MSLQFKKIASASSTNDCHVKMLSESHTIMLLETSFGRNAISDFPTNYKKLLTDPIPSNKHGPMERLVFDSVPILLNALTSDAFDLNFFANLSSCLMVRESELTHSSVVGCEPRCVKSDLVCV